MGTAERKERQKAELRERILKEAREIVVNEGFGALTIRKVAEAVEYAPGTIYLYFENRDDIAKQLCLQGFQELLAYLEPEASVADPRERLEALLRAYVRFGAEHAETYRLIFMGDQKFAEAVFGEAPLDAPDAGGLRTYGFLVEALEELKKRRRLIETADTRQLAEVLWAAVHGVVSLKLTSPNFPATPVDALAAATIRTLLNGVLGPIR